MIREFESRFDDVELTLVTGGSGRHVGDVEAGVLDAAFVRASADWCDGLAKLSLQREPFVCVAHADEPLVRGVSVERTQLAGSRVVLPSRDTEPGVFDYLSGHLLQGLEPAPSAVLQVPTLESLYSTVAARRGVGILSESRAALLPSDATTCLPFAAPAPTTDLLAIWKPDRVGQRLRAFLDVVRSACSTQPLRRRLGHDGDAGAAGQQVSRGEALLAHS